MERQLFFGLYGLTPSLDERLLRPRCFPYPSWGDPIGPKGGLKHTRSGLPIHPGWIKSARVGGNIYVITFFSSDLHLCRCRIHLQRTRSGAISILVSISATMEANSIETKTITENPSDHWTSLQHLLWLRMKQLTSKNLTYLVIWLNKSFLSSSISFLMKELKDMDSHLNGLLVIVYITFMCDEEGTVIETSPW